MRICQIGILNYKQSLENTFGMKSISDWTMLHNWPVSCISKWCQWPLKILWSLLQRERNLL